MKKIMFILAAMFAAVFANAQTTDVQWGVNDSSMGIVTCIHPVIYYDTVEVDTSYYEYSVNYDSILSIDSVFNSDSVFIGMDTTYACDSALVNGTIEVIDTSYNTDQWFLIAESMDSASYFFLYWINENYRDSVAIYDTVYSEFNLIDITAEVEPYDRIFATAYFTTLSSINDVENANVLTVYPNPTTGIVWFNRFVKEYYLYDECGRSILNGVNGNMINMSSFKTGMYFLKTPAGITKIIKK